MNLQNKNTEQEFTFINFFVPLSVGKGIFWMTVLGFFVFGNGLFNGFVGDDDWQITNNLLIHSISNIVTFFMGSTFYNGGIPQAAGVYYKPILSVYYSLIYTFFGANTFVYHFFQLILHITNACLVFLVFKRFFKILPAYFLALIFLLHPMNSEAVFYASAAQEPLFFFFGALALYYLGEIKSEKKFIFAVALLFLSLFSKETGVIFLAIATVYTYFYNRKYFTKLLFSSAAILIIYVYLRIYAIGVLTKATNSPIDYLNFFERMINVPTMFLFYVKQFVFPLDLSMSYQWAYKQITVNNFVIPLIIDIAILALFLGIAFWFRKKRLKDNLKAYAFFLLWFLAGIAIHMQIFPLDATLADRWLYLPIVGLLGMIGVFISDIQLKINKKILVGIIFLIIFLFASRTFIRSFNWRDNFSIVSNDIKVSKDAYDLENGYGYQLFMKGNIKEAKVHVERSIKLFPYLTNYNNLGVIYVWLKDYEKAKEAYENALKFGEYYLTYDNLAGLGLAYGDPAENIKFIHSALGKFPQDANLWKYLAVIEYVYGEKEKGKNAAIRAYQYNPNNQDIVNIYNAILNNQPLKLDYSIGK